MEMNSSLPHATAGSLPAVSMGQGPGTGFGADSGREGPQPPGPPSPALSFGQLRVHFPAPGLAEPLERLQQERCYLEARSLPSSGARDIRGDRKSIPSAHVPRPGRARAGGASESTPVNLLQGTRRVLCRHPGLEVFIRSTDKGSLLSQGRVSIFSAHCLK